MHGTYIHKAADVALPLGAADDEIFRKPGSVKRTKELMALVNTGADVDFLAQLAAGAWSGVTGVWCG